MSKSRAHVEEMIGEVNITPAMNESGEYKLLTGQPLNITTTVGTGSNLQFSWHVEPTTYQLALLQQTYVSTINVSTYE